MLLGQSTMEGILVVRADSASLGSRVGAALAVAMTTSMAGSLAVRAERETLMPGTPEDNFFLDLTRGPFRVASSSIQASWPLYYLEGRTDMNPRTGSIARVFFFWLATLLGLVYIVSHPDRIYTPVDTSTGQHRPPTRLDRGITIGGFAALCLGSSYLLVRKFRSR